MVIMKKKMLLCVFIIIITSCQFSISVSNEIGIKVVFYARKYANANTKYVWGGRDNLHTGVIEIDCSGLVVQCYRYAISDNIKYDLLFKDANVKALFKHYVVFTDTPAEGDIIFMSEEDNNDIPTHIGIYIKTINNNIYFIDATQKEDKDGNVIIDGVSERFYNKYDKRFKCFAKMKLLKK